MPLLLAVVLVVPVNIQGKPATDLAAVARKYEIEVVVAAPKFPVKLGSGVIDGAEAAGKDVDSYAPILAFEWSLYPPELVKKTQLKKIVLCRDLAFDKQKRTAVPDFENDVLYLDVARGRDSELYTRKVIHHEFFHIIDYRDDGNLYTDERWAKLNPPGFKYGEGGAKLQNDPSVTVTGQEAPGFLNRYAAAGVEEDKAEVFAHLLVEPKSIADRAATDKYMRGKVERMKELLAAFTPKMDAAWWKKVESAQRAERK